MSRRITKPVYIGTQKVGGTAPISVQSMTKTDTRDIKSTVNQINELEEYGCEIFKMISSLDDLAINDCLSHVKLEIIVFPFRLT